MTRCRARAAGAPRRARTRASPRPPSPGCRSTCAPDRARRARRRPLSSEELAAAAGVNSAKLRKDLSYLGSYGTRGVGYDVEYLVYQISRELGLTQDWPVVIVGIGNLGHALANYGGFASPRLPGRRPARRRPARGRRSRSPASPCSTLDELETSSREHGVSIGVIATPAGAAQEVCDRLVAAGVTSILNFAPTVLSVPDGVDVRKVDLSIELQILAFHEQRKAARCRRRVRGAGSARRRSTGVPRCRHEPPRRRTVAPDRAGRAARARRAGRGRRGQAAARRRSQPDHVDRGAGR